MRDRLIELLKQAEKQQSLNAVCGDIDSLIDSPKGAEFIADYLLANGVVVLPYSIGSKVYSVINSMTLPIPIDVYECEIQRYVLTQHGISAIVKFKKGSVTYGDIHKDVSELHLTREEAERALKGGEG